MLILSFFPIPPSFGLFILSFLQEYSSEQTMQALRRLSSPLARAVRECDVVEVGREGKKEGGEEGRRTKAMDMDAAAV